MRHPDQGIRVRVQGPPVVRLRFPYRTSPDLATLVVATASFCPPDGRQMRRLRSTAAARPCGHAQIRTGSRPTHSSIPATFRLLEPPPQNAHRAFHTPERHPPAAVASRVIRGLGGVRKPSEAIGELRQWQTRNGATLCTFRTVVGSSAGCSVAWSQTMPETIGATPRTRWRTTASRRPGALRIPKTWGGERSRSSVRRALFLR